MGLRTSQSVSPRNPVNTDTVALHMRRALIESSSAGRPEQELVAAPEQNLALSLDDRVAQMVRDSSVMSHRREGRPRNKSSLDIGRSAQAPRSDSNSIAMDENVVFVKDIQEMLNEPCSEADVLHRLAKEDDKLRPLSTALKIALVSYRQEPGISGQEGVGCCFAPGDCTPATINSLRMSKKRLECDRFSLDGPALRGVLKAAEELKADALWLDQWCYRRRGEYNHRDFCNTLHYVISTIACVVWLPQSKENSRGEYGYRLWVRIPRSG